MLFGKLGGSEIALFGEVVKGASHKRVGKPCQDSRKILVNPGSIILATADGHGSSSSPHSKYGSQIAVNVFCKVLMEYLNKYEGDMEAFESFLRNDGDTTVSQEIENEWKSRVEKANRKRIKRKKKTPPDEAVKLDIWRQYGTTLLGLVIMPSWYFAFQLGDGDIMLIDDTGAKHAVEAVKLLGTETHSLSQPEAWKRAVAAVGQTPDSNSRYTFIVSTDGFANSYPSEEAFIKTCIDYFETIKEYGAEAIESNLTTWLNETSAMGSGDDITVLFAYNGGSIDG